MADVFISYKKERRAHAKRLAAVIEAYGFDVWWDYGLLVDAGDYDAQIEQALLSAKAAVVLWCSGSRSSGFVKDEARRAREAGKLLPVLIERGVEPPLGFGMAEMAFLVEWTGDPTASGVIKLIESIERLVKRKRKLRPNVIDTLREAAPLKPVEHMIVVDGEDTNAPARSPRSEKRPEDRGDGETATTTILGDLRATWQGLDRRSATLVARFRERVAQVAPGSGLEFEVESALSELTARETQEKSAATDRRAREEQERRTAKERRARATEVEVRRAEAFRSAAKQGARVAQDGARAALGWFSFRGQDPSTLWARPVPVHFEPGSSVVKAASNPEFKELWLAARRSLTLPITITANTAAGSLGKSRADAVASYLRAIGVANPRLHLVHAEGDAVTITLG